MTIGGRVITLDWMTIFTPTYPHLIYENYLVSTSGFTYTPIERIVIPFAPEVWLCILVSVVVEILFLCYHVALNSKKPFHQIHNHSFGKLALEIIGSAFGNPLTEEAVQFGTRIGFTMWLLALMRM